MGPSAWNIAYLSSCFTCWYSVLTGVGWSGVSWGHTGRLMEGHVLEMVGGVEVM